MTSAHVTVDDLAVISPQSSAMKKISFLCAEANSGVVN